MSDYLPTTQEVRNRYVFGTYWENDGDTSGGDNAPFNRWLANHDAKIAAETEQRIIKLLERDCKNGSIEFAIALIKGENNG